MWDFHNPVKVTFGLGALARIGELVGGRRYVLATYAEPLFARLAARVADLAGPPLLVIDGIEPNPDFIALDTACRRWPRPAPEVIVALGGGSVIDAAKVLAAARGDFAGVRARLQSGARSDWPAATPILAVPTTAGTGSEVTSWASVWDTGAGRKYSLAGPGLYPERALIDPELMAAMPRGLTVSTALDALSHSLESIWNVNANPVSSTFAVAAAREILEALPRLVEDLEDMGLRVRIARAALLAGLAFSNTRTALAHSLSYPITLNHGLPHGVACSFSLPMIMRAAIGVNSDCDATLAQIFGDELEAGAARLADFLERLGVSVDPAAHGVAAPELETLIDEAYASERGRNYIGARTRVRELCGLAAAPHPAAP